MSILDETGKTAARARYTAAQGLRSAWYGAQYAIAKRRSAGFNRPGEPKFVPSNPVDTKQLRASFFRLFAQDRANIEAGLYPKPEDVRLSDLPKAVKRARHFLKDVAEVDRRRVARDGDEVAERLEGSNRYPDYYRQNFHYQTDGWLSDESAKLYDHQVEALFTGSADAMRRAALAEIAHEMKGRDQREVQLLDLACGTGRFLRETMRAFPRLKASGLDLSPNYAERARKQVAPWPQVEIIEGQAEVMPLEDESCDIIVSIYLFHELPLQTRRAVMKEAARVLKPGGAFIVADSLQFGDESGLDGILEYFPEGFHEPYYKEYLGYDFEPPMIDAGFGLERSTNAFLTKVNVWRKTAART
ncbi:class I SAM-dependent methyltransferase [Henriciella litoralis]|uniref:class I SAM-dependent methyltransferase n=1 Tax=Henriciella litoralis TaxID=568102 RepID=UPI0009FCDD32|nr:class I SAM-dependent methyltransferase [Henriciella litoralis]